MTEQERATPLARRVVLALDVLSSSNSRLRSTLLSAESSSLGSSLDQKIARAQGALIAALEDALLALDDLLIVLPGSAASYL
eukprot:scaffold2724_cov260-Pinguiococcus_pyrenoidosus.AAC.12